MIDRVGEQLGNYRLIRSLGSGGFADVFLGEHVYLNRQAAIKNLQTRLAQNALQVFLTEARTIANLSHRNIVQVLEFGVEQDTPFLVMTYAPNGTLRRRHPNGSRLSLSEAVSYIRQVADALQYAHDRKVIHRDIKPENGSNRGLIFAVIVLVVILVAVTSAGTAYFFASKQTPPTAPGGQTQPTATSAQTGASTTPTSVPTPTATPTLQATAMGDATTPTVAPTSAWAPGT